MLSSHLRGLCLIVFWLFLACVYQSCLREEGCLPSALPKDSIVLPRLMKVVIEDKSKSVKDLHSLEKQINKMSIEVIDLKLSQGVPHGI
jgi:hypothetical protein